MTNQPVSNDEVPLWFKGALGAYLLGAFLWFFVEMGVWLQPGVPYDFKDVCLFTAIWPLRVLVWLCVS